MGKTLVPEPSPSGSEWFVQVHAGNPRMARVVGPAFRAVPEHEGGGWCTDPETAAMMAAAPELLAALKDCRRELYWCAKQLADRGLKGVPGDSVDQAEIRAAAAVAKAEAK